VRAIDTFVNGLDLKELGINRATPTKQTVHPTTLTIC